MVGNDAAELKPHLLPLGFSSHERNTTFLLKTFKKLFVAKSTLIVSVHYFLDSCVSTHSIDILLSACFKVLLKAFRQYPLHATKAVFP